MKLYKGFVALAATTAATLMFAPVAHAGSQLEAFNSSKSQSVSALAQPLSCIDQRDAKNSSSPIFHGCFDWHSAVHAHYALYAASELTGNKSYAEKASQSLSSSMVSREATYMRGLPTTTRSDNPYGFAWFLKLAQQAELAGNSELKPLADYAASQVASKLSSTNPNDSEYGNASWNALRLYEWAKFSKNADLESRAKEFINSTVKSYSCRLSDDAQVTGFFAKCAMRLAAVVSVEGAAAKSEVDAAAQGFSAQYLANGGTSHQSGRNFSQAYALAVVARTVGNEALAEQAASLINRQVQESDVWSSNYTNSHWIPQFGILAIQALSGKASTAPDTAVSGTKPSTSDAGQAPAATRPGTQPAGPGNSAADEGSSPAIEEGTLGGDMTSGEESSGGATSGDEASGEDATSGDETSGMASGETVELSSSSSTGRTGADESKDATSGDDLPDPGAPNQDAYPKPDLNPNIKPSGKATMSTGDRPTKTTLSDGRTIVTGGRPLGSTGMTGGTASTWVFGGTVAIGALLLGGLLTLSRLSTQEH